MHEFPLENERIDDGDQTTPVTMNESAIGNRKIDRKTPSPRTF